MFLELKRDFIAVPLMGVLGIFNGLLYVALFWKIDETPITFD